MVVNSPSTTAQMPTRSCSLGIELGTEPRDDLCRFLLRHSTKEQRLIGKTKTRREIFRKDYRCTRLDQRRSIAIIGGADDAGRRGGVLAGIGQNGSTGCAGRR